MREYDTYVCVYVDICVCVWDDWFMCLYILHACVFIVGRVPRGVGVWSLGLASWSYKLDIC